MPIKQFKGDILIRWISLLLVAFIFLALFKPSIEDQWSRFMGFVGPHGEYRDHLMKEWSDKPSNFLIRKLTHPSVTYSGVAEAILFNRKDTANKAQIVRLLSSHNKRARSAALSILFSWDEKEAIELCMDILKSDEDQPLFQDALYHLSMRGYQPAYKYVLEFAQREDALANGSVEMLKNFNNPDSISVLEKMYKKIRTSDRLVAKIDKTSIDNAIKLIKEKNNLKGSVLES